MAEWLEQASQWHEMYCHDLEVMSSNLGRVELGVRSTSVLSRTWSKNKLTYLLYHTLGCVFEDVSLKLSRAVTQSSHAINIHPML